MEFRKNLILIFLSNLIFFFNLTFSFSVQNITCGTYNSVDTYYLNQSLSSPGSTCITFNSSASGSTLDCQGYNITGDGSSSTYGFLLNQITNFNIKNCNIYSFYTGIYLNGVNNSNFSIIKSENNVDSGFYLQNSYNNFLSSLNLINNSDGLDFSSSNNNSLFSSNISKNGVAGVRVSFSLYNNLSFLSIEKNYWGIYFYSSSENILYSSNIYNNSEYGIYFKYANNNSILTVEIKNSSYGVMLADSSSNNFSYLNSLENLVGIYFFGNSQQNSIKDAKIIKNNNFNLEFNPSTFSKPNYNIFNNNLLGNISKITASNWSGLINYFNYSGIGNIYYNLSNIGTGKVICFDSPTNNNCDYLATIQEFPSVGQTNLGGSIFPIFGANSIFISIILIFSWLFF